GFKLGVRAALGVAPERLASIVAGNFSRGLEYRIVTCIEPAFERALEGLSDAYLEQAPDRVGLAQYPGGAELYAELVRHHTTLDLTPAQVHARGLERMQEIEASIRDVQTELGFAGDSAAFTAYLDQDLRWRANTVEGVTAVFQRYIDRLKPHLGDLFAS